MRHSHKHWLVWLLALGACTVEQGPTSTSDDDDDDPMGTCAQYEVPAGTDLTQPIVSFRSQVIPIFHAACSNAQCHGSSQMPASGVFLGPPESSTLDAGTVHRSIVGMPSRRLETMLLVTAGDPTESFLMHKMDGDQCAFDCGENDCGALMPEDGSMPLPVVNRDIIRRWIAQGARDN
jgi:hypothetical protein